MDKPFVLYLRSFDADERMQKHNRYQIELEGQVAIAVSQVGRLVAVGSGREETQWIEVLHKHGFDLSKIRQVPQRTWRGAERYLYRDGWQEKVVELMTHARLVVVVAGLSPSLGWELETLVARDLLPKTVVLVPSRLDHHQFMQLAEAVLGQRLPIPPKLRSAFSAVPALLYFDASGCAQWVPVRRPPYFAQDHSAAPEALTLWLMLRPVLRQLGLRWEPLPVHRRRVTAVFVIFGTAALVLAGMMNAVVARGFPLGLTLLTGALGVGWLLLVRGARRSFRSAIDSGLVA